MDSEAPIPKLLLSEEEDKQEEEFEEDDNERTPCMSHSSSITSHESIVVLNKRGSVYSTNSSNTSGKDHYIHVVCVG